MHVVDGMISIDISATGRVKIYEAAFTKAEYIYGKHYLWEYLVTFALR